MSIHKKKQQNCWLISQLDDFDQNNIIGDAVSSKRQIFIVNNGLADREFTVSHNDSSVVANENAVEIQTSEEIPLTGLLRK